MPHDRWRDELQIIERAGFQLARGLTAAEIARAERVLACEFPPDLRTLLAEALPTGKDFPDWREPDSEEIRKWLSWPFRGIAFDIERNAFWWPEWGERPADLATAIELARVKFAGAPRMIPVHSHRYIPAEPALAGNPVFSVYQTDTIYYGRDLASYLRCEFGGLSHAEATSGELRPIRFWTDLVESET